MSADQDTTRIVRSWLRTDEHVSADRILGDVLARLDATPQRRPWVARRIAPMHPYAKFALTAAAVLVVAVVGINLLNLGTTGPGDQVPSPSPSIEPPSPSPSLATAPLKGALEAGTYSITQQQITRQPFAVTVPEGWRREDNFVYAGTRTPADEAFGGDRVAMATWIVSHIYADSCQWEGTLREATSVAEVVQALTEQTGHESTEPTETTFAGYPATRIDLSLPADTDVAACDSGFERLWPDAGPNESYGLPIYPGQTTTVYVVDLDGQPQLFMAISKESSSPADVAALEQVIESITFE